MATSPRPIQSRIDTAANWTSANPVLLSGEVGYESDTKKWKVGDGSTLWASLAYWGAATAAALKTGQDEPSYAIAAVPGSNSPSSFGNLGGWSNGMLDSSTSGSVNMAATNRYTLMPRIRATGAAAAISRCAGPVKNSANVHFMPATGVKSGFAFRCSGGIADANAAGQFAMGLFPGNVPIFTNSVEPSSLLNSIIFGADSGDAQMSVMHNDGAGSCVKEALNGGAGFPNNTNAADFYDFYCRIDSDGVSTITVSYIAINLVTKVIATGSFSTQVPVAGTNFGIGIVRGSANVATTPVCDWGGFYAGAFA